jgi:hypothetical protein
MDDMKRDIAYLGAQIEETNSNVKAILEIVVPMQQDVIELKRITADIPGMKQDIKIIKAAVKSTSIQVTNHEHRITCLEATSA